MHLPLKNLSIGVAALALFTGLPEAWQQKAPPSSERAQEQPFPAGSPFALLPGFKIERVTPADKTESYIVVTFDPQGRPVVSQSSSGAGSSPRVLLDENKDGIYEGEKIVAEMLNTCHGLFYANRTTLYGDCRGEVPGDPPPPAEPQFGRGQQGRGGAAAPGAPGAPGAPPQQGGGGRGQNQPPARGVPGFYKLEDTNGDDVMDRIERINGYAAAGMGDHGPHAIRRGPDGSIMFLIGNNTYVGSRPADGPVNDAAVDTEASPNWNNVEERQFLPQFNDPRFGNSTRIGVHATVWRLQPNNKYSLFFSGMRNPYDFAFNVAGEAFTFDSDMEWDVNAPWYREVRTVHMIPGGDGGYRNGTGKFQDEYFDIIPAVRHLRRGSPVGVEFYQSYAYPEKYFDNLFEADWSRGRLLYTALTPSGATYTGREDLAEFVHGEPMPITDLEVGPDGNIYLTTGGAAGQGGLYKVSWTGAKPAQPDMTGILAVVRQPQPLSSWAWDAIEKVKASMGASFGAELEKLARSATAAPRDRSRALLEMQRHGAAPNAALLQALLKDRQADVRAAAAYVAGLHSSDAAKAVAAAALKDAKRAGPAAWRRSAGPSGHEGERAAVRADRRCLRAAQESRSIRPLFGSRGARTHAQGPVGQARDGGDQRGRVDRGSGRHREHHARGAVAVGAASGLREAAHTHAAGDTAAGREDQGAACVRGGRGAVAVRRRSRDQEAGLRRARQTVPERTAGRCLGALHEPDGPARRVLAVPARASPGQGARLHR